MFCIIRFKFLHNPSSKFIIATQNICSIEFDDFTSNGPDFCTINNCVMKIKDRCKPILYSCILLCYNIIKVVKEIRIMKIYIVRHGQDDDSIRGG